MKSAGVIMVFSTLKVVFMPRSITWRNKLNLKSSTQSSSVLLLRMQALLQAPETLTSLIFQLLLMPELHSRWTIFLMLICPLSAHIQRTLFSWHVILRVYCHLFLNLLSNKLFISSFQDTLPRLEELTWLLNRQNRLSQLALVKSSCPWTQLSTLKCLCKRLKSTMWMYGSSTLGNFMW